MGFKAFIIFIIAGALEIVGGYCVWIYFKNNDKSIWYAVLGAILLIAYGIVATFQPESFARVYAAYGGFFIIMSLFWGWHVDKFSPDRYDILGILIVIVGVYFIYFIPRNNA